MAQLTREKGSKGLVANFATGTGEEVVLNDFDSKYPFSGIEEVVDNGEYWVKIPRFYRVIYTNDQGVVTGREVSEYKVGDDWLASPVFTNYAGTDLASVEIAKYQASVGADGKLHSVPNATPLRQVSKEQFQSYIDALNSQDDGYEYLSYNVWMAQVLQDLFTIEFANSNSRSVMEGYHTNSQYSIHLTGTTDVIKHHTGCVYTNGGDMKYRGIEHLYGNGSTFIDDITITGSQVAVNNNGQIHLGNVPATLSPGYIHQLQYDRSIDIVLPKTVASEAVASYGDYYQIDSTDPDTRFVLSHYDAGVFGYICTDRMSVATTYRIVRRIKK